MKFFLISDYLPDEVLGGCEINNAELASILRKRGHQVFEKKSAFVETGFVFDNSDSLFIISNFVEMSPSVKQELETCNYIIYEHDHKYLQSRNPAEYIEYKAPTSDIINLDFYRKAIAVLCQSNFHSSIVEKNTGLTNIVNISGNLWSEESLDIMEEISKQQKKKQSSILNSPIPHKNTYDAIRFCEYSKRKYDLVSSKNYHAFLHMMGKNEEFVFFPKTPETLSRVACEARMMNMKVTSNNLVGATKEPWFTLKGPALISRMRKQRETIALIVEGAFQNDSEHTL